MTNPYYSKTGVSPHTLAKAEEMNAEFLAIERGFDLIGGGGRVSFGLAQWASFSGTHEYIELTTVAAATSYKTGMRISFIPTSGIISAAGVLVDVNGIGQKAVIDNVTGLPVEAGAIVGGRIVDIGYDGTSWRLLSVVSSGGGGGGSTSYPSGIISTSQIPGMSGNGTDDDSVALNTHMAQVSLAGGGLYILKADSAFYFKYRVRVPSFINLVFASPIKASAKNGAGLRTDGKPAEFPETNLFRLLEDATTGEKTLRLDTGPQGGGLISEYFRVGDELIIRGMNDAAINPLEREVNPIVAIDDDTATVTLLDALQYSYKVSYPAGGYEAATGTVDRTYITRSVYALLTADAGEEADSIEVEPSRLGQLSIGSYVMVADLTRTVSGNPANKVVAQIIGISGTTVSFDRRLARNFLVSDGSRVSLIKPAIRANVSGASITYVDSPEPAPASRHHAFEIYCGLDCHWRDCEVPNNGAYGNRGDMFRVMYSYRSGFDDVTGINPKSTGSGEGYGHNMIGSTGCISTGVTISGARHSLLFHGSTDCIVDGADISDDRLAAIDFHGWGEVECGVRNANVAATARTASGSNTAIKFGNTAHRGATRRCFVDGVTVSGYSGVDQAVIRQEPGAHDNAVMNGKAVSCYTGIKHRDLAADPDLVSGDLTVRDFIFEDMTGPLIDLQGGANGSTIKTMTGLFLSNLEVRRVPIVMRASQIGRISIFNMRVWAPTTDPGDPYLIAASDIEEFRLMSTMIERARRGLSLAACPEFAVSRCDFVDFVDDVLLLDGGGNTNGRWFGNHELGFTGTRSGTLSTIDEQPSIGGFIISS